MPFPPHIFPPHLYAGVYLYGLGHWDKVAADERLRLSDKLAGALLPATSVVGGRGPRAGSSGGAAGDDVKGGTAAAAEDKGQQLPKGEGMRCEGA